MSTYTNNDVSSGNIIYASDHNEQGARIAAVLNGGIDNNNISASAAIDGSKFANDTVSASKLATDAGGNAWQSWTPTITGYSANPTNTSYTYKQIDNTITLQLCEGTNGTSNATTKTYTLPFTARTLSNAKWTGWAQVVNSGSGDSSPALISIDSAGTTLSIIRSAGSATWTASGNARVAQGQITYEKA